MHGARASSAHAAAELWLLTEHYQLLLPDVPSHSVRGPQTTMPRSGEAWSDWLKEVIAALDVDRFDLLGVSWGGFIATEHAARTAHRPDNLILIVPAGFVGGAIVKGVVKIIGPMMMYKLFPSEERLRGFMEPMMTTWDDDWANYIADAMVCFEQTLRDPPRIDRETLESLDTPTLVIAGTDDLTVPGRKLVDYLDEAVPHAECELLEDCKHIPPTTDEFRAWVADRVAQFADQGARGLDGRRMRCARSRGPPEHRPSAPMACIGYRQSRHSIIRDGCRPVGQTATLRANCSGPPKTKPPA